MSELILPVSLSAQFEQLRHIIVDSFKLGQLDKIVLSKYKGDTLGLEKIQVRIVELKQLPVLCFVYKYKTKDTTKNFNLPEALDEIAVQLDSGFKHLHVNTPTHDYQLMVSKKAKVVLAKSVSSNSQTKMPTKAEHKPQANLQNGMQAHDQNQPHKIDEPATVETAPTLATHNREKHRYIEQSRPFLQQLGVTDAQAQIIPAMSRKWKQINKFLEIFAGALEQAKLQDQQTLSVVDFGSGKGYLTFAVHDYIAQQLQKTPEVNCTPKVGHIV